MLGAVIAARLAAWGRTDLPLERTVFGTDDPDAIAAAVDAWCRAHLGASVVHYHFFESSSGSVHGVALADGRDVVVKVHRPACSRAFLTTLQEVQRTLVDRGLPGPRPLSPPVPAGPAHLTAETMLPLVPTADGHDPRVRRALTRGLAQFVATARDLDVDLPSPMATNAGDLYPQPHSARFDFAATAAGAEWIDALMSRAHAARTALEPACATLVHGDWRIENVAVLGDEVVGIFDWDSVCVEPEVRAVASAARTFSVDWDRPDGEHFPADAAIAAFITEYEHARDAPFTENERRHLAIELVVGAAYGARCEHAIAWSEADDTQQAQLRRLGPALLDRGLAALGS